MTQVYSEQQIPSEEPSAWVTYFIEFRQRLLRCLFSVVIIFFALFYFANDLYHLLATPLLKFLPANQSLIATGVITPIFTPLKLTLFVSLSLAIPYILYQVWRFIAPALFKHEKRYLCLMLVMSSVLFYSGIAFAYTVVFPLVFNFIMHIAPTGVAVTPDISQYLQFALRLFFAFGLAFQVPVVIMLLVRAGIVSIESLKRKRPYMLVIAFTLGMLLTPPDVISQIMLAVPMYLLFELGLLLSQWLKRS